MSKRTHEHDWSWLLDRKAINAVPITEYQCRECGTTMEVPTSATHLSSLDPIPRLATSHAVGPTVRLPEGVLVPCTEPHLGLATTQQLIDEITTRIKIDYYAGGGGLDYSTVKGRPDHDLQALSRPRSPEV